MNAQRLLFHLLAATALLVGPAFGEDWECGTTEDDLPATRTTCEGTFKHRAIFVTFPNAVSAKGDSLLPTYADTWGGYFKTFIDQSSLGKHIVDWEVVKRPGADSVYAWVLSHDSSYYSSGSTLRNEIRDLLDDTVPGWDTDLELPIYCLGTSTPCCGLNFSVGGICPEGQYNSNFINIRWGSIIPPNSYLVTPEYELVGLLVHEFGHQLGVGHSPNQDNEEGDRCYGGYFACYDAMCRQLYVGCDGWQDRHGIVPYHVYNRIRFGWLTPTTITETTTDVQLRDVMRVDDVVKIPLATTPHPQYFLIANHQLTGAEAIYAGRGLLIWHIVEAALPAPDPGCPTSVENDLVDVEHQSGMFERTDYCPDWPHVPDAVGGVDTLDCVSKMLNTALYSGLSLGGGIPAKEFAPETNPSTDEYRSDADWRLDPQDVDSGVEIRNVRAFADSVSGKYVMEFDVVVDGE